MTFPLAPGATIGIVGGGQLGRMLVSAAAELGLKCVILTPPGDTPAADLASDCVFCDGYEDRAALARFAGRVDAITYEFENIPVAAVELLGGLKPLRPGPRSLELTCDRLSEKTFIESLGIKVAPFAPVEDEKSLESALIAVGAPSILKTRRLGYDGKGQAVIRSVGDAASAFSAIGRAPAILEGFVSFEREVSVVLTRAEDGAIAYYDVTENVHSGGILSTSTVPARLADATRDAAIAAATRIAEALGHIGTMATEFFVERDGSVIVNEIAPRVHNSGHWTMDACAASQFQNHIRAVAGWPLGDTSRHANAVMENLLGEAALGWQARPLEKGAILHLYGKAEARSGRKMGHINRLFPMIS